MSKFFLRLIKLHKPKGMCNLWSLKKFTRAYLFQTAGENLCDYILIIEMEKKEIAYHNYADAKHVHQVQK